MKTCSKCIFFRRHYCNLFRKETIPLARACPMIDGPAQDLALKQEVTVERCRYKGKERNTWEIVLGED